MRHWVEVKNQTGPKTEMNLREYLGMAEHVAIIGSSGRGVDVEGMDDALLMAMRDEAFRVITEVWCLSPRNVVLVSGGSSWSDFVAVRLYLDAGVSMSNPRTSREEAFRVWRYFFFAVVKGGVSHRHAGIATASSVCVRPLFSQV